ncbi:hypothetical protein V6N13_092205 [Hibiscus sabdariffa]
MTARCYFLLSSLIVLLVASIIAGILVQLYFLIISAFIFVVVCGALINLFLQKGSRDVEEDHLDNMLGLPSRFSYQELQNVTKNFSHKLGEGGFGSVFRGTLPSGTEVAVKHLDGFGSVNKSFVAEVQTIGSIHHFNLVRLVGFCAEKFNRVLVYEHMANGSLDRFGIVVLEILCGRRNIDGSQQENDRHLLELFKSKLEEGRLVDLVDKRSDDMQSNAAEVVEMMKVAAWCLQTEYAKRPSMSAVIKLLEGSVDVVIDVFGNLNEDFLNGLAPEAAETLSSIVLPSLLSGPR